MTTVQPGVMMAAFSRAIFVDGVAEDGRVLEARSA